MFFNNLFFTRNNTKAEIKTMNGEKSMKSVCGVGKVFHMFTNLSTSLIHQIFFTANNTLSLSIFLSSYRTDIEKYN